MQWLKEIPSHWNARKMKYCFSERSEKNHPDEPILCATQSQGVIPQSMYANRVVVVNKGFEGLKLVKKGDFVISLRSFEGGIEYAYYQGIISAAYTILQPNKDSFSNYWKVLFKSHPFIQLLQTCVTGIREGQNINYSMLCRAFLPLPPLAEQEKIVSYLEDKTSKIDAYVADKEKEIELLQELKQKTIADAVTKGLNPDAKMKDSGISWIGEIPEHWETRRAKFMFKKNKRERRPEDEVITCFRDGQVTLRKNRRLTGFTESEKYDGYQGIRKGDLVIHQMDAFAGSIGVSDSDGMGTSVYHCCTPIGDFNVYYYAYLIRQMAMSGFIQSLYKGIRERSSDFSFPVFGNQFLLIPPLNEQQAIVAYIEEKCEKIDKLASELQSEIDYLKEYKQRLIADCVTGQVNVQNEMI